MIAELQAGQIEVLSKYGMTLSLWILSVAITGWVGFRYGLRSQKEAARLKAKNDALAIIDRILAEIWDNRSMWGQESKSKSELKKFTIQFSSQFPQSDRSRIKASLDDYLKLCIKFWEWPVKGTPDRDVFDKEYKAMVEGLKKLRDEISGT